MSQPLTINDIADFLQMVIYAFNDYIYFGFILMVAFAVAMGVKQLFIWGS